MDYVVRQHDSVSRLLRKLLSHRTAKQAPLKLQSMAVNSVKNCGCVGPTACYSPLHYTQQFDQTIRRRKPNDSILNFHVRYLLKKRTNLWALCLYDFQHKQLSSLHAPPLAMTNWRCTPPCLQVRDL